MSASVNVSDLLTTIENIQYGIQCPTCFVYFNKKWCENDETSCFFCSNFVPSRDTYNSFMDDIDWYYINSNEYDYKLYCKEFKYNFEHWMSEISRPKISLSSWLFL